MSNVLKKIFEVKICPCATLMGLFTRLYVMIIPYNAMIFNAIHSLTINKTDSNS